MVWVLAALRRGRVGVDLIAVLSLIGTLLVGEYLAGALIAVMLAGGRALEAAAERRASHDLRALLEHAPRFARRRVGSAVSVIALDEVAVDDLLVVGPGEVVPVDGRIAGAAAVLDESVLTGEPLQVERGVGEPVRSGVVNAGSAFEMHATATAADSTYAHIVRLADAGRGGKRAGGAAGRPVCGVVLAVDAVGGGRGVAGQRVAGAGGGGAGGGDSVPAVACRAGRDRVRAVAGLASRCGDPQRRRAGKPGPRNDFGDGQDRHADHGTPRRHRCRGRARARRDRDTAAGGLGGSDVPTCAGRGDRHRGAAPRPAAVAAHRGGRRARARRYRAPSTINASRSANWPPTPRRRNGPARR